MKQKFSADEQEDTGKIQISSHPVVTAHEVKINCDFQDAKWCDEFVKLLEDATENDHICIRLNSPGGNIEGLLPILAAMETTQAHLHGLIEGTGAASAAAFVALKCDTLEMPSKYSQLMIHGCQLGLNMQAPISHVQSTVYQHSQMSAMLLDDCLGFLKQEEVNAAKSGSDLYFNSEQTMQRWYNLHPDQAPKEIELS